jgi:dTDP-glucose 4,6-dehydratase
MLNDLSPILVTGGAGFIGSNFVLDWLALVGSPLVNLDKLTYAGNLQNLTSIEHHPGYHFEQGDICDAPLLDRLLDRYQPRAILHFAAESHVDRSLSGPEAFVRTNVDGTFRLLEAARAYLAKLTPEDRQKFRFLHVSTDEVYGTLRPQDPPFEETTAYAPNSPYAASKAGSDHLVRAYVHSYGLPAVTTNCSNNYGPYQFPEKLLPLMITNGDHCSALRAVLERGEIGETYNIGGRNEQANLDTVELLCSLLDEMRPSSPHVPHRDLITFVTDRPGHDRRYAINATKIEQKLGWRPAETFATGLRRTVQWYLAHQDWVEQVTSGAYRQWIDQNYAHRGGARR